jgi:outer membrane protein, heavy metal efflux system
VINNTHKKQPLLLPASARFFYSAVLLFVLPAVGLHAQQKLDLAAALQLCTRDSNAYLKAEAWKIELAKAEIASAKASGNIKYNNQAIHLSQQRLFVPETKFYNKLNMQTLHQVTKTVPYPGQRAAKISFARENVNLSSMAYEEYEFHFKKQIADLWLDAWIELRKSEIYAKHFNEIDSITKLMQQNFSTVDFKHIQILQEEYLLKMNKTKVLFNNRVRKLKLWIGSERDLDFTTLNWIEKFKTPSLTYDSIAKLVKMNRPEFQITEEKELLAKKELRVVKNSAWEEPELGILINPQNTIPYLGTYFTFSIPSFDRKRGEISKAKIRINETTEHNTLLEKELYAEAQNIVDLYTINFVDLQLAYNYRSIAETEVKNSRSRFLEKKTEILDYLQGERDYFQTHMAYFEALYDFFKSKNDLMFATGLVKTVW